MCLERPPHFAGAVFVGNYRQIESTLKHLPHDSTSLVSFPKRPEYVNNSFTLTFEKVQDITGAIGTITQADVAEVLGLAECTPVIKFLVDGASLEEGAWVLTVSYEGVEYDSKLLYVNSGEPSSSPAGSGVYESITILP